MKRITSKTAIAFLLIIAGLILPEISVHLYTASIASTIPSDPAEARRLKVRRGGSVGMAEGKAVVVTIFSSDRTTSWDKSAYSLQREDTVCTYLDRACGYISGQAEKWNKKLSFVCDFEKHPDLLYYMNTGADLQDEDQTDEPVWQYINQHIDTDALVEKYKADGILFLVCTNTDESNKSYSATRTWYEGMPYPYEFVNLYYVDSQVIMPPAVYAHEILHTFGAPDLYAKYIDDGVTQADVDWVAENRPNDIMYTCSDIKTNEYVYDRVTNKVTDVTAWYLGWTDALPDGYGR